MHATLVLRTAAAVTKHKVVVVGGGAYKNTTLLACCALTLFPQGSAGLSVANQVRINTFHSSSFLLGAYSLP